MVSVSECCATLHGRNYVVFECTESVHVCCYASRIKCGGRTFWSRSCLHQSNHGCWQSTNRARAKLMRLTITWVCIVDQEGCVGRGCLSGVPRHALASLATMKQTKHAYAYVRANLEYPHARQPHTSLLLDPVAKTAVDLRSAYLSRLWPLPPPRFKSKL
jgi:hypothetical protein